MSDRELFEHEVKQDIQKKTQLNPTLPVNGCLWVIILSALACIAVRGCKMVGMKYNEAKAKHEITMDSLNKIKSDTIYYRGK